MKRVQLFLSALFLLGTVTAFGQAANCANCQNLAPTGDMSQITTSGQGSLNPMNIDWHASHGSPSYSPGQLWMWSYNNAGEGVFYDGFTFLAGHTYCVTFDAYTRTHDNSAPNASAGFNVIATSSVVPSESGSGGGPIPAVPALSQYVASEAWSALPMNAWATYSYTFTATGNWSQLWFYPHSPTLPQTELTLQNLRICDISVPNPCDFQVNIEPEMLQGNCGYQFHSLFGMPAGLQVIQYIWDFGDGTTSTDPSPIHYYTSPGAYSVTLTVLVINDDGECCARRTKIMVEAGDCDPCDLIHGLQIHPDYAGGMSATFTTNGPDSPNYVYLWDFGDGTTGSGHTVDHTYANPGGYSVTVRIYYFNAADGVCCSYTTKIQMEIGKKKTADAAVPGTVTAPQNLSPIVVPIPEHLKERPSAGQLQIFPNPTNDSFTVTNEKRISRIDIVNMEGSIVQSMKPDKATVTVSLHGKKAGTYQLIIVSEDGSTIHQSVVKQ